MGDNVTDNTLVLRAQEIINNSDGPISDREAIKRALMDRYPTFEKMAEACATFATGIAKQLKKSTYELPEQDGLFDIPATISNTTPDGVLFINREQAELGQVRQWVREGRQHHSTQHMRFKRAANELIALAEFPDDLAWVEARRQLETHQKVSVTA